MLFRSNLNLWLNQPPSDFATYTTLATLSPNTWYGLRLDVLPVGTSGDQVKCYIENGSPGSGIWGNGTTTTPLYDQFIPNTSPFYAPWGGTIRNGFGARQQKPASSANANIIAGYVDKVTLTSADAPTPIP